MNKNILLIPVLFILLTGTAVAKHENKPQDATLGANPKQATGRSITAKEHMSIVSTKVEELLTTTGAQGGIGAQISEIAKQQQDSQKVVGTNLDQLTNRNKYLKKIFGADKKAIRNLNNQMAQNQLRVQQLQQLQTQVYNQGEITQIQETVEAITQQNTSLQERINAEEEDGGILEWMVILLNRE